MKPSVRSRKSQETDKTLKQGRSEARYRVPEGEREEGREEWMGKDWERRTREKGNGER